MAFRIKTDTSKLAGQLNKIGAKVQRDFGRRYLPVASGLIAREQNRHFMQQVGPDGTAWKPLSQATKDMSAGAAKRKVKSKKQKTATVRRTESSLALIDTGLLRASVSVDRATGAIRTMTPDKLTFGTNLKYARLHQFGATLPVTEKMRGAIYGKTGVWMAGKSVTIPARPFLGTSQASREGLAAAARYVLGQIIKDATR